MRYVTRQVAANGVSQDRLEVFDVDVATLIVLADGAGGMAGAGLAAEMVVDAFRDVSVFDAPSILASLDSRVAAAPRAGETTAVVIATMGDTMWGGSAGDSEAWLLHRHHQHEEVELTRQQRRKRVGSGSATIQPISATADDESEYRLLVASDGLFRYASYADIKARVRLPNIDDAADSLLESVRLSSGRFRDDVSIFVAQWP